MKPNCFGLPSLIHREAPHCAACPFVNECERVALNKALALGVYIKIPDVIARLKSRGNNNGQPTAVTGVAPLTRTTSGEKLNLALTVTDHDLLARMPAKVRVKVEQMMKRGQDLAGREALKRGENPFPFVGSQYQHVACEMLLAGGFTRSELRRRFMDRLGWTEGTAYPHVTTVVWMFLALGFAEEVRGKLVQKT
jgi:hypothetical protein